MSRWGSCDFSELRRFAEEMERLEQDMTAFSVQMVRELAERTLAKVVRRTPVGVKPTFDEDDPRNEEIKENYWNGYVGGNLRRSWQIGNVVRKEDHYEIEIFNSAEYASYVEYGHRQQPGRYIPALGKQLKASWVKGRFMMTISEQELRAQAPAIIEKRMREFFEGALS